MKLVLATAFVLLGLLLISNAKSSGTVKYELSNTGKNIYHEKYW